MSRERPSTLRPGRASPRWHRRGGVYVLVLGAATMIAVVGLGAIAVSRSEIRSTRAAADWSKAGIAAEAAIEAAVATMNTRITWRDDLVSGDRVAIGRLGDAAAGFSIVDSTDGDLATGDKDGVTVFGFGRVGEATRVFSLDCQYRPPPTLDVLAYALYASGGITVGTAAVSNAPLGTPSLTVNGTLVADVRVGTLANNGTIIGEVRTGASPVLTLSDGSLSSIASRAVTISYASIPGGTISSAVLSSASNPYGSVSSAGIYIIRVPLLSTLTITNSRINATLIVELSLTSRFEVSGAVNWSPSDASLPTLIVSSLATSTVRIGGTTASLDEAALNTNFNPKYTPYQGVDDTDRFDLYPSEIRGVIHSINSLASVEINNSAQIVGVVICEGAISVTGGASIRHDPQVLLEPPTPYRTGDAGMDPVAGTWLWQVQP